MGLLARHSARGRTMAVRTGDALKICKKLQGSAKYCTRVRSYHVGHARCVVPAVKTKQNLVRGRVWCRLSSERVHSMNYTRTRVHHMCYITPRVYSVTSGTRVTVRHACYSTPRVYATRVHHAYTPRPGYRPRHAAIWHCPYRYEIIYEEYGCMFV